MISHSCPQFFLSILNFIIIQQVVEIVAFFTIILIINSKSVSSVICFYWHSCPDYIFNLSLYLPEFEQVHNHKQELFIIKEWFLLAEK